MSKSKYHLTQQDIRDEMLQVEAAKQDKRNFEVIYDKYYKQVFVFIYNKSGNETTTADLTSQVFLKALMNIEKYKSIGVPFSAWLFRIAINEVNQYYRKANTKREIAYENNDIKDIIVEIEEEESDEREQWMLNEIQRLDKKEIQIIELRFFEKFSFKEVGDIIGITENNAKVKTYRILEKLRKLINHKIK